MATRREAEEALEIIERMKRSEMLNLPSVNVLAEVVRRALDGKRMGINMTLWIIDPFDPEEAPHER